VHSDPAGSDRVPGGSFGFRDAISVALTALAGAAEFDEFTGWPGV
jgi:hypothetical protein